MIPPAATEALFWQKERIEALEEYCAALKHDIEHLRTLLAATQKALKDMQAQRDKAREGKR